MVLCILFQFGKKGPRQEIMHQRKAFLAPTLNIALA